jgi:DNA repair protein RecO (recombination protein O)
VNDFQSIKNSYESMSEVALLLELIQQCIGEDAPHQSIFQDLMIILNSPYLKEVSLRFMIRILHVIGYDLNLTGDGQDVIGFHIPTASLIYFGDSKTSDISMEDLILLLQLKYTNYDTILKISDTQVKSIKSFLIDYIEYHVHIKIKNR